MSVPVVVTLCDHFVVELESEVSLRKKIQNIIIMVYQCINILQKQVAGIYQVCAMVPVL